jgi:hypothetical protein
MFYDDDIDVFFDEFAEDVIYTRHGYNPVTMSKAMIFDLPGSLQPIGRVVVSIERPQGQIKTAAFPNLSRLDTFIVQGTEYKISEPPTDNGTGITTVILAEGSR